MIDADIDIDW